MMPVGRFLKPHRLLNRPGQFLFALAQIHSMGNTPSSTRSAGMDSKWNSLRRAPVWLSAW
jgi:hypothetical protein